MNLGLGLTLRGFTLSGLIARVVAIVSPVAQDLREGQTGDDITNIATLLSPTNYTNGGTPQLQVNGTAQSLDTAFFNGDVVRIFVPGNLGFADYSFTMAVVVLPNPAFSVQPSMPATVNIGESLSIVEGVAGPGATLEVVTFTLDGVDKRNELSGLVWDTTGESAGLVLLQVRATNNGGSVLSNIISSTLQVAPSLTAPSNLRLSVSPQ